MSGHTPGPWTVGCLSRRCVKPSHRKGHPGSVGADPCVYDHVELLTGGGFERCVSSETDELIGYDDYGPVLDNEADAHLIAAAPDLLEALRGLTARTIGESEQKQRCVACGRPPHGEHKRLCEIEIARAAIAKAEGR